MKCRCVKAHLKNECSTRSCASPYTALNPLRAGERVALVARGFAIFPSNCAILFLLTSFGFHSFIRYVLNVSFPPSLL